MPGLPMLRPGGKARLRCAKGGYGGRAGGGMGHGNVESESWKITQGEKKEEIMSKVECVTCSYFMFSIEILQ